MKKLTLTRETVRALQDSDLRAVVGGLIGVEGQGQQMEIIVHTGGGCSQCICPSSSTGIGMEVQMQQGAQW